MAEASFRAGLSEGEEIGLRPLAAHCRLGLGRLFARIGRRDEGRAQMTLAIEAFRAMGMASYLATAEVELGAIG
jgi:hypothetical protein